jgi:hypothetical protein
MEANVWPEKTGMVAAIGVTKAITNLNQAHQKLGLALTQNPRFFQEWCDDLPVLSQAEMDGLDRLKKRYLGYADEGAITEGTVNLILLSPLLELLGLIDSPYKLRSEKYIRFEIEDGETILDGLIDALIVCDQLWLIVIESKRYGFSVRQALGQTVAYMSAAESDFSYGLITTGEDYLFTKLDRSTGEYALSDKLTLTTAGGNGLYQVAQVIKQLVS